MLKNVHLIKEHEDFLYNYYHLGHQFAIRISKKIAHQSKLLIYLKIIQFFQLIRALLSNKIIINIII